MIDFSALVLGPAMAIFGGPVMITPVASRPGAAPYPARGSYASKPVEVPIQGSDLYHQSQQPTLGIRLSEFASIGALPPIQGDIVVRTPGVPPTSGTLPDGIFEVYNVTFDGQGGADLELREIDRA